MEKKLFRTYTVADFKKVEPADGFFFADDACIALMNYYEFCEPEAAGTLVASTSTTTAARRSRNSSRRNSRSAMTSSSLITDLATPSASQNAEDIAAPHGAAFSSVWGWNE